MISPSTINIRAKSSPGSTIKSPSAPFTSNQEVEWCPDQRASSSETGVRCGNRTQRLLPLSLTTSSNQKFFFLPCDHCTASVPEEWLSMCNSFFAADKLKVSCKCLSFKSLLRVSSPPALPSISVLPLLLLIWLSRRQQNLVVHGVPFPGRLMPWPFTYEVGIVSYTHIPDFLRLAELT